MLDIQMKHIKSWTAVLDKWGAQYKIVMPDGTEFGTLDVVVKKRKRTAGPHPYGTLQAYFKPLLEDMTLGDVVVVPFDAFEGERLRSAISAWGAVCWGKGSCSTYINREEQTVEVMRTNEGEPV